MNDHHNGTTQHHAPAGPTQTHWREFSELDLLRMALNQVDYGMVVVEVQSAAVQFANTLGRDALADRGAAPGTARSDTGLTLAHGRVMACRSADAGRLRHTLERTRVGVRGLLSLGRGEQSCAVAVVPLSHSASGPGAQPGQGDHAAGATPCGHALLVFAKKQLCDDSTVALYARSNGLTSAEGQVLAHICHGLRPAQIAHHHGVQISTVRTQLRSIRQKTCSQTIRDLVQKVSVLPPMARQLTTQG